MFKVAPFRLALGCGLEVGDHAKSVVELPVWVCIDISFEFTVPCFRGAE